MSTNIPPMTPAGPPPAPTPKKTSPLVWILIGVAGFFVLIVILFVGLVAFGLHKAKQAGLDPDLMRRNPAVAAVKLAVAMNPDAEIVKLDENRGVITVRDKKTGKVVTMNFEDVRRGKLSFEDETGSKVSIEGQGEAIKVQSNEGTATLGAGPVKLPEWLAAYPGSTPQGSFTAQGATGSAATFHFTTQDSPAQVMDFYAGALKKAGLSVETTQHDKGGQVAGQDAGEQRSAVILVAAGASGTEVNVSFKAR